MMNQNRIDNIPNSNANLLHSSTYYNLTNLISNPYSENEFNNLILNSNLENYNTIK